MDFSDRDLYRNISIHISDRSHWNLALNVYNCGNQNIEIEHYTKPDYYIFYFVKEGKGYVTVRQATHKVGAGQGFVLFPNEEARVKSEHKGAMNVTWVAFSGHLVDRYLSRAKLSVYKPVFSDNSEHEVEAMFDRLLAVSTTLPNRYCKIMAQLYSIFGFLLDNAFDIRPETVSPEFYLIKALDFIDANYQDGISVEDIAANAGINRKSSLRGVQVPHRLFPQRLSDLLPDVQGDRPAQGRKSLHRSRCRIRGIQRSISLFQRV